MKMPREALINSLVERGCLQLPRMLCYTLLEYYNTAFLGYSLSGCSGLHKLLYKQLIQNFFRWKNQVRLLLALL